MKTTHSYHSFFVYEVNVSMRSVGCRLMRNENSVSHFSQITNERRGFSLIVRNVESERGDEWVFPLECNNCRSSISLPRENADIHRYVDWTKLSQWTQFFVGKTGIKFTKTNRWMSFIKCLTLLSSPMYLAFGLNSARDCGGTECYLKILFAIVGSFNVSFPLRITFDRTTISVRPFSVFRESCNSLQIRKSSTSTSYNCDRTKCWQCWSILLVDIEVRINWCQTGECFSHFFFLRLNSLANKYITICFMSCGGSFILLPIVLYAFDIQSDKWLLPTESKIFFIDNKSHPGYELNYLFTSHLIYCVGFITTGFDLMFFHYCIFLCVELDVGKAKCLKIGTNSVGETYGKQNAHLHDCIVSYANAFVWVFNSKEMNFVFGMNVFIFLLAQIHQNSDEMFFVGDFMSMRHFGGWTFCNNCRGTILLMIQDEKW